MQLPLALHIHTRLREQNVIGGLFAPSFSNPEDRGL
jgi:hypothetical protein